MIRVVAGGKKSGAEITSLISEYQKRCKKPFEFQLDFFEEKKLVDYLARWPFSGREFVIICDERGKMISSPEVSGMLERAFVAGREIVIIIGGAFGVSEETRERADFVWSFSKLVFPHQVARLIVAEQIYRAQEIAHGGKYHHD